MLKKLLLALLLIISSLQGMDQRLFKYPDAKNDYVKATQEKDQSAAFELALFYDKKLNDTDKAIEWYTKSYEYGSARAALNLGNIYKHSNKTQLAIEWYKKAYKRNDTKAALALGIIYEQTIKNYTQAVFWYKESSKIGNAASRNNLGYLYEYSLKDFPNAKKWYKKGANAGSIDANKNLGRLYFYHENNKLIAGAYFITLIDAKYSKQKVLDYLKTKWKLSDEEIQKAYQIQLTLDIPNHYTGGID